MIQVAAFKLMLGGTDGSDNCPAKKITELTGLKIPHLKKYLNSNEPWREEEAVEAIRSYQSENAAKGAAREAKRKK
jgi:hypothetical protein